MTTAFFPSVLLVITGVLTGQESRFDRTTHPTP